MLNSTLLIEPGIRNWPSENQRNSENWWKVGMNVKVHTPCLFSAVCICWISHMKTISLAQLYLLITQITELLAALAYLKHLMSLNIDRLIVVSSYSVKAVSIIIFLKAHGWQLNPLLRIIEVQDWKGPQQFIQSSGGEHGSAFMSCSPSVPGLGQGS